VRCYGSVPNLVDLDRWAVAGFSGRLSGGLGSGGGRRVSTLLGGAGHRVFAFGANVAERAAPAAQLGEIGEVREGDPVLTTALGVGERGLVAVRPDGYIGLVADSPEQAAPRGYRTRCLHALATNRVS
jgi:hypothetical protein